MGDTREQLHLLQEGCTKAILPVFSEFFQVFLKDLVVSKSLIDDFIDWARLSGAIFIVMVSILAGIDVYGFHVAHYPKMFDLAARSSAPYLILNSLPNARYNIVFYFKIRRHPTAQGA